MAVRFKIVDSSSAKMLKKELRLSLEGANGEDIDAVVDEICESEGDGCEYALSSAFGCLLVRIYDGEYSFPYPIALTEGGGEYFAIDQLRAYTVKEEIPLVISDIPRDALGEILPMFRHMSLDCTDPDGEYYTLRVSSELSLAGEVEGEAEGDVELSHLRPEDEGEYARLCRDAETNRYWGYDFREDTPDCEDAYFLESAENELARGVAVCFAVRCEGKFAGEGILYGFDLQGGVQSAVRILPEHRRKGLGALAFDLLSRVAQGMGLIRMYATVAEENTASNELCKKYFDEFCRDGENYLYTKYL